MFRFILAALLLPGIALAQAWPERPVRVIVPFPPGGGTEAVARLVAAHYQEVFGQPFIIESRSGASGMLGTELAARAAPDGYTISMTASGPLSILPQMLQAGYDPIRSFEHVLLPSVTPLMMVVPTNRPPNTMQEFVAWAGTRRGQINYCSIGVASPSHLSGELFARALNVEMTHIPHRGSGPALLDTIAGHCDVLFDSSSSSGPHIRGGRLKALAITTPARHPSWPDLPTMAEQGATGYATQTWSGLVAPAGTPPAIIARLAAAKSAVLRNPEVIDRMRQVAIVPMDGTPEQFPEYLAAESAKWGEVIRSRGITLE